MSAIANSFPAVPTAFVVAICISLNFAAAAKPKRIVSTNVCADQLVMLLADPENIVSVSRLAAEPEVSNFSEQARSFHANGARAEEIVQLRPDLVVGDVQTGKHANKLAKAIGVPVHIVDWPASISDVRQIVLRAGEAIGEPDRARKDVEEMTQRISRIETYAGIPLTALVYEPNGLTTGAGTLTDDLLRTAGLNNLASELTGTSYGSVPLERVIAAAPRLLILDDSYTRSSSRAQSLLRHPAFRALEGRTSLFRIPSRLWLCPGPWVAEAVERLADERRKLSTSLAPAAVSR
ncbi:MAG: ABC transporter substrate-binding protein [Micropepsaceae bacterium]